MFFKSTLCKIVNFFSFFVCLCTALYAGQPVKVAITQIAPHPSLDSIRNGIIDELTATTPDIQISFENAQGNIVLASQIAKKLVDGKPNVVIPITTPSAQSIYPIARSAGIPVVFSAITDPVAAKLVPSLNSAGDQITGVADVPPLEEQLRLVKEMLPNLKTLGVIYNSGEANSVSVINSLSEMVASFDITLVPVSITSTVDVSLGTQSFVGKVDALFIPNDNTVVSALESLLKITMKNNIPVFASDPDSVKKGCLAAFAPSQYEIGRQTGRLVNRLLAGASIETLPVETPTVLELSLNEETARQLSIEIPDNIRKKANIIVSSLVVN